MNITLFEFVWISWITNVDWKTLQGCEKQPHNWELIKSIYNKFRIISPTKKTRKNKSRKWVFFQWWWTHTRKVNEKHRWWRLKVKIWREEKKHLKSYNVQKYEKIKYNFDVETNYFKIDKYLNAKLLKFNMILHYMLNSLLTSTIHTTTHYWKKKKHKIY